MREGWCLIVYKAPPHNPVLHRLGLRPTRKNPSRYVGYYAQNAKPQLLRHIEMLKEAGLHGKAVRGRGSSKRAKVPKAAPVPRMWVDGRLRIRKLDDAPFARPYAELQAFAKKLRANQTLAEVALWGHLGGARLGVRARRQHVLAGYIADFYIPAWRLIIELDGSSHNHRGPYDARRDEYLRSQGFHILRFANDLALNQPLTVVAAITAFGRQHPPAPGNPASSVRKVRSLTLAGGESLGAVVRDRGRPMDDPSSRAPHSRTGSTMPASRHQGDVLTAATRS